MEDEKIIKAKAVQIYDIIIYSPDIDEKEIQKLIDEKQKYISDINGKIIIYENNNPQIGLYEWQKYKVITKDNKTKFKESDFYKKGEYGTSSYGTLLFKNCCGITQFCNIPILINTYKLDMHDVDKMTECVNNFVANLSYDFNQPTYLKIDRDIKKVTDLDYHIYLLVMNLMKTKNKKNNLFINFSLIKANPNRQMTRKIVYRNINEGFEITEDVIVDILSGNVNLTPCNNLSNKLALKLTDGNRNYIPKEISCEETIDLFDNNENRFIKYFIKFCLSIIEKFDYKLRKKDDLINISLLKENKIFIEKLKMILNTSFLNQVGEIQTIPMNSTILIMKDGYRQLFNNFLNLQSLPRNAFDKNDLEELIEDKSLDVLYENYCYFVIVKIISKIYDESVEKKKYKIVKTEFEKTLKKKTNYNYFLFNSKENLPKIKVNYNKNYAKGDSYSKSYDPDISIEILDANDNIFCIYLFDAKFKATIIGLSDKEDNSENIKLFKYDDISKMHTYKDAIIKAKGAYVIYPGTESRIYLENNSNKNEYLGVGAFPLNPNNKENEQELEKSITRILKYNDELMKTRYNKFDINSKNIINNIYNYNNV